MKKADLEAVIHKIEGAVSDYRASSEPVELAVERVVETYERGKINSAKLAEVSAVLMEIADKLRISSQEDPTSIANKALAKITKYNSVNSELNCILDPNSSKSLIDKAKSLKSRLGIEKDCRSGAETAVVRLLTAERAATAKLSEILNIYDTMRPIIDDMVSNAADGLGAGVYSLFMENIMTKIRSLGEEGLCEDN